MDFGKVREWDMPPSPSMGLWWRESAGSCSSGFMSVREALPPPQTEEAQHGLCDTLQLSGLSGIALTLTLEWQLYRGL